MIGSRKELATVNYSNPGDPLTDDPERSMTVIA